LKYASSKRPAEHLEVAVELEEPMSKASSMGAASVVYSGIGDSCRISWGWDTILEVVEALMVEEVVPESEEVTRQRRLGGECLYWTSRDQPTVAWSGIQQRLEEAA
jgi:hypothetical protein